MFHEKWLNLVEVSEIEKEDGQSSFFLVTLAMHLVADNNFNVTTVSDLVHLISFLKSLHTKAKCIHQIV